MSKSSHSNVRRLPTVERPRTLLVIPAFNEASSIGEVLERIRSYRLGDVLVVSDASVDETAAIAQRRGVHVLNLPLQLGAWGATQAGLRFALRHGYDRVVSLDADGQHEPACIQSLLDAQQRNRCNVVIGTHPQRLSAARKLAWHWFRSLSGLRVEDLTSGFRVYDRRAIALLGSSEATLLDYQDVGVLLLARKHGLGVTEVPVQMYARRNGQSKVFSSWLVVLGYMLQTTVLCIARIGRFNPPRARGASA